MNQKCCSTCENMRTNRADGTRYCGAKAGGKISLPKRYCVLKNGKEIRLRYAKKRPDWCPKVSKGVTT